MSTTDKRWHKGRQHRDPARLDIGVNRCDNEGLGFCVGAPFREGSEWSVEKSGRQLAVADELNARGLGGSFDRRISAGFLEAAGATENRTSYARVHRANGGNTEPNVAT